MLNLLEVKPGVTFREIGRAIDTAGSIYSTPEGAQFIRDRKRKTIDRLIQAAGANIDAVYSVGYPNYVMPLARGIEETPIKWDEFVPVPEIQNFVKNTRERLNGVPLNTIWQCPDCFRQNKFVGLSHDDPACSTPIKPFGLFFTVPDIDLYIVVPSEGDAIQVAEKSWEYGLYSPEHNMEESIRRFPRQLTADFHFIPKGTWLNGISQLLNRNDWTDQTMTMYSDHGELVKSEVCFGLDFVFSLLPHHFRNPEMYEELVRSRGAFVARFGIENLIHSLQNSGHSGKVPKRIGRLMTNYPAVEQTARQRLLDFREEYLQQSEDTEYILPPAVEEEGLYELLESVAGKAKRTIVMPEELIPFFGQFSPSLVEDINRKCGTEYPACPENNRLENMAQAFVVHGSLDNILFEGHANNHILEDRYLMIKEAAENLGIIISDSPLPNSNEVAICFLNNLAFQVFSSQDQEPESYTELKSADINYPFVKPIRELLGEHLKNIILYGSSTKGRKGNDYDLEIFVNELTPDLYGKISSQQSNVNSYCDREVHIVIVPESSKIDYLALVQHNIESLELVYGDSFDYPVFPAQPVWDAIVQAVRYKRLILNAQSDFREPERNIHKPQVIHGPLKLFRYIIEAYRNLYADKIVQQYFDNMRQEILMPEYNPNPTGEDVKRIRAKVLYDLISINRKILQLLNN